MVKFVTCCCCCSVATGVIIIAVIDLILGILSIPVFVYSIVQASSDKSVRGSTVFGSFYAISIIYCILIRLPRGLTALNVLIRRRMVILNILNPLVRTPSSLLHNTTGHISIGCDPFNHRCNNCEFSQERNNKSARARARLVAN
jgi:hypothetical protein